MSPRPRRLSDSAILTAAAQVVSRTGPERFTLADVGQEVGLSPATLVQRFGSKRRLLLLMHEQMVSNVNGRFVAAAASGLSPLEALYAAATDRADPSHGPSNLANAMAFTLLEINDPEFHAISIATARTAVESYKQMLDEAIEAGELVDDVDTLALAETVHSLTIGSLMMWVIMRESASRPSTRRDLDTLLRPYRTIAAEPGDSRHTNGNATGPKSETPAPYTAESAASI